MGGDDGGGEDRDGDGELQHWQALLAVLVVAQALLLLDQPVLQE